MKLREHISKIIRAMIVFGMHSRQTQSRLDGFVAQGSVIIILTLMSYHFSTINKDQRFQ